MDDILNKVDGIVSKGSEIMVVLTIEQGGRDQPGHAAAR